MRKKEKMKKWSQDRGVRTGKRWTIVQGGERETQRNEESNGETGMSRRVGMSLRKSTTERRMEKRSGRKRNNGGKKGGVRGNGVGGGGKQRNGEWKKEEERIGISRDGQKRTGRN